MRKDLREEIDDELLLSAEFEEPSIVDRLGALADPGLAKRVEWTDRMIERKRLFMEDNVRKIAAVSKVIHKKTVRATANWVIASPAFAKQLDPTGEFSEEISEGDL
jgi:hypothetical protein